MKAKRGKAGNKLQKTSLLIASELINLSVVPVCPMSVGIQTPKLSQIPRNGDSNWLRSYGTLHSSWIKLHIPPDTACWISLRWLISAQQLQRWKKRWFPQGSDMVVTAGCILSPQDLTPGEGWGLAEHWLRPVDDWLHSGGAQKTLKGFETCRRKEEQLNI